MPLIFHPLSPEQIDKTVADVIGQLPEGHTGALAVDVDQDGVTFAAELVKKGTGWELDAEGAFKWDYGHDVSAGAKVVWSW